MVLSVDEARSIAQKAIEKKAPVLGPELRTVELQIVDRETIERPYGWIFFYNSRQFLETDDIQFALAGNGPVLVDRVSGEVIEFGTAYPVEAYLNHYEETGEVLK